jgi:hypothetical protein
VHYGGGWLLTSKCEGFRYEPCGVCETYSPTTVETPVRPLLGLDASHTFLDSVINFLRSVRRELLSEQTKGVYATAAALCVTVVNHYILENFGAVQ